LFYKASGSDSEHFFTEPDDTFPDDLRLPADSIIGISHTKTAHTACGSSGYITFELIIGRQRHTIFCGFCTAFDSISVNSFDIQIRMSVGNQPETLGNMNDHSADATEAVINQAALFEMTKANRPREWNYMIEPSTTVAPFRVR
jgi:hypothetical protein